MTSPGIKTRLAEIGFYAGQTVVAIGHYDARSTYHHYWVFCRLHRRGIDSGMRVSQVGADPEKAAFVKKNGTSDIYVK